MMVEDRPTSLKLMMTLGLATMGQRAFMNRTVGEVLWGYDDPLVNFMNKYFPDMFPFKGKFGLFAQVSVFSHTESRVSATDSNSNQLKQNWEIISSSSRRHQDCVRVWLDPVQVGGVTGV